MYGSRGYRVIAQGKALSLKSHRHAVHAMLHCPLPEDMKLFGVYPVRHAVMVSRTIIVSVMPNTSRYTQNSLMYCTSKNLTDYQDQWCSQDFSEGEAIVRT